MWIKCFQIFIIFLFLQFNLAVKGGTITENVDSLKRLLETAKEDTQKVNILNRIAFELSSNSPDSAMQFAKHALQLAKEIGFKKGIAGSYNNIGTIFRNQGEYSLSLDIHFKSLKIFESLGDKMGTAYSYNNIALIYCNQGNYSQALDFHFKSLKIKESLGDNKGIAGSFNNIAGVYYSQGNYSQALDYYFKSLKIKESLGDKKGVTSSYNNIALIYANQGNYSQALDYYFKSLKIRESLGDKQGIANSFNNIAVVYYNQGNYSQALDYYFKSLKIREFLGDKQGIANLFNNIAVVYYNQGNYSQALDYYLKSLKIREFLGDKQGIAGSFNNIALIYYNQGNYSQVLDYYFKSLKIRESLGDKQGIAGSFINIGELLIVLGSDTVYNQTISQKADSLISQYLPENLSTFKAMIPPGRNGLYHHALQFLLKSVNMSEEIGDNQSLTYALPSIGKLYVKTNKVSEAIPYYIRSIEIAKEIGSTPTLSNSYLGVSEAWFQLSNQTKSPEKKVEYMSKAFESLQKHVTLKDTLFNEQSIRSINEMQTKYETEKKEREIEKQASKIKLQDSELSKKQLQQYVLIGALIIIFVIAGLLYNRFLIKKKSNKKLTNLNDQLQTANTQLQQKSDELQTANEQISQEKSKVEEYADALKNSNKELETFASICSHDLKEPLRKIRYNSEMLVRKTDHLGKDEKDILTRIDNAANRMNTLITDLLAYSHVTTKQLPHEPVDLNIILKDVLTDLEVKISDTKGKVEVDKLPTIEAVPLHMRQLFQNLISNALKFHKPDVPPVVKIKTRNLENSTHEITVEDNGIGFEQKHADQIFKPFHRLHTRTAYEGTGMGTTICERIVKKLGGDISVKSELDKGTCFIIVVPSKQKVAQTISK